MKWLLLLLLAGCAAPLTDEQKVLLLVERYGPRCGIALNDLYRNISDAAAERVTACMKLHIAADQVRGQQAAGATFMENLSFGLRGAGEIMGSPASVPTRRRDFMCFSDCSRRYSPAYCESLCSY